MKQIKEAAVDSSKLVRSDDFQLERELKLVYKGIADTRNGIVITDHRLPDDPIIYVNSAFERMTGYSREEILHKNCRFLQGDEVTQPMRGLLCDAIKDGSAITVEIHNYRKDGSSFWNELSLSPIKDTNGAVTHFIGIQNDVTRRRMAEDMLRLERDELEARVAERTKALEEINASLVRSNTELQDFAYVASHDLQEPLRKIQSFGNLLNDEYASSLSGDGVMYLDRMLDASGRMRVLINDLLAYSRVTTKARIFAEIDLNEIIQDVLGDMEADITFSKAEISVQVMPKAYADPMQMRQLFQNLLSNSLKFHQPNQPPVVSVTGEVLPGGVCIIVADKGIGFEAKYTQKIFTIFQRLHGKDRYGGTGIGLAVVRKIVERHNATIAVTSKIGEGTTFSITIPHSTNT